MTPFHYRVLTCRVIDGDTIQATVDLGFHLRLEHTFRLARIDAPELPTLEGKLARTALFDRCLEPAWNGEVTLTSMKPDKYGRWLCELYVAGENLNDWMLAQGYAKEYGK